MLLAATPRAKARDKWANEMASTVDEEMRPDARTGFVVRPGSEPADRPGMGDAARVRARSRQQAPDLGVG